MTSTEVPETGRNALCYAFLPVCLVGSSCSLIIPVINRCDWERKLALGVVVADIFCGEFDISVGICGGFQIGLRNDLMQKAHTYFDQFRFVCHEMLKVLSVKDNYEPADGDTQK